MVERVNRGDKEALRELMSRCTRPMYDRALEITGDSYAAKDATRRALREMADAARRGECPENIEQWSLALAQRCCDEELYYKRLIDSMIDNLPSYSRSTSPAPHPTEQQEQRYPLRDYAPTSDMVLDAPSSLPRTARVMPLNTYPTERAASETEAPGVSVPAETQAEENHTASYTRSSRWGATSEPPKEALQSDEDEDTSIFAPDPRRRKASRFEESASNDDEDDVELFMPSTRKRGTRRVESAVPSLLVDEDVPYQDDDEDEELDSAPGGTGLALLIIVLTLVAPGLLWIIAVKLMTLGYLGGISDFGFAEWFNKNLFKFY